MKFFYLLLALWVSLPIKINASSEIMESEADVKILQGMDDLYDFEVGVYCGEFYLKIIKDDLTPYEASLFTWTIQTNVMSGEITDWIFPDDASFVGQAYRYKTLRFNGYPVWNCTITLYFGGILVNSKTYNFYADKTFDKAIL